MEDHYKTHGAFSWHELMTTDAAAAKDFYTRLFGWQTEAFAMENMNYTVVKVGEEAIGGIMATPPEAEGTPPH